MIEAFAIFRARHDDALLYLHTELSGAQSRARTCRRCSRSSGSTRRVLVVDQYRYLFEPFAPEEMAAIYASLDVLLNASMGEGFGLTVLEAQACGVPAIVTDFTAMREVCGAGWKVGYERYWTDQASWQARPRRRGDRREPRGVLRARRGRARRAVGAGARARARPTTPTACSTSTGCPRSSEVALRLPGIEASG